MVARISTDVAGPPLPTDSDQLLGSEHAFPERRGEGKAHRLSTAPRTMGRDGGNQTVGGAALAWGWLDVVCTRPPRQPHPSALVAPGIRCVWLVGGRRSLGARVPGIPAARGAILGCTALIATPAHVVESHRNHKIGGRGTLQGACATPNKNSPGCSHQTDQAQPPRHCQSKCTLDPSGPAQNNDILMYVGSMFV